MSQKFDFKSIKYKIWIYLLAFAILIIAFMFILQTFFLNNYYEDMKIRLAKNTVASMTEKYNRGDMQGFLEAATAASESDDIYVIIQENDKTVYPSSFIGIYENDIKKAKEKLSESYEANGTSFYTKKFRGEETTRNVYIYASYLDHDPSVILFTITPLSPVPSTVKIFQDQFVYIMIIALFVAVMLSFYLSSKVSKPITRITKSAQKLADGQYGITFPTKNQYSELNNLSITLNKASSDLEKFMSLQKDLMANVSHDLRTPLTMIKSYAEMIRDLSGDNPEKRANHLQVIIEEADRLNLLVSDMLALSAMQSGTMSLNMRTFNILDAIESVILPYKLLEEKEGFKIIVKCKDNIYVNGDLERIKQVISNLLTNAIKYCGIDKKIFLNVKHWSKKVHIEVIDHGVGIKAEELPHIWERYYKTSSNHVRTTEGSGLGLSIVKEILLLHSASFGAESKEGRGTTIWFELKSTNSK